MFGEDDDDEDKGEQPSERKVEEALGRGDVPQSADLAAALQALVAVGALAALGGDTFKALLAELATGLGARLASSPGRVGTPEGVVKLAGVAGTALVGAALPIVALVACSGTLGTLVQRQPVLALGRLAPDFSRLDPVQNATRLFGGGEGSGKAIAAVLKLLLVAAALSGTLGELPSLLAGVARSGDLPVALGRLGGLIVDVLRAGALALLVAGAADLVLTRKRWFTRMGMTKEEAKREAREQEGDPHVKGRLRQLQRQVRQRRGMLQAVKTADVVLANPTHVAVALRYDRASMSAPKVVAKGTDAFAQQLKAAAREAGVPVIEDRPLARALLGAVPVGGEVPPALYQGVAKALAFVHRLRGGRR